MLAQMHGIFLEAGCNSVTDIAHFMVPELMKNTGYLPQPDSWPD